MIEVIEECTFPLSKEQTFSLFTDIEYIKRNTLNGFQVSHSSSNPFGYNRSIYIRKKTDSKAVTIKVVESDPPKSIQFLASSDDQKVKAFIAYQLEEIGEKTLFGVSFQLDMGHQSLPLFMKSIMRFFVRWSIKKELRNLVRRAKTYA